MAEMAMIWVISVAGERLYALLPGQRTTRDMGMLSRTVTICIIVVRQGSA